MPEEVVVPGTAPYFKELGPTAGSPGELAVASGPGWGTLDHFELVPSDQLLPPNIGLLAEPGVRKGKVRLGGVGTPRLGAQPGTVCRCGQGPTCTR